jgi:hypothetical protein
MRLPFERVARHQSTTRFREGEAPAEPEVVTGTGSAGASPSLANITDSLPHL